MKMSVVISIDRLSGSSFPEYQDGPLAVADSMEQAEAWLKSQGFKESYHIWIKSDLMSDPSTFVRAFIYPVWTIQGV